MEHSKHYSYVKYWYSVKVWDEQRVKNAVKMQWITEEEYKDIVGKDH